jgi:hypothetical protein
MERSATDPRETQQDERLGEGGARGIVQPIALTRERAALLAAPFEVRSRPNGGIVARLTIPTGGEEVG